MCGISGIAGVKVSEAELKRMVSVMGNRGPDGSGLWFDDNRTIGLGHTRLSIIDLSDTGQQPMISRSRRFIIVFNGEIYNYRELKRDLEREGFLFGSNSDTEVVLNAWEKWGFQSIEKLRGMFAFAIWDTHQEKLFLVRDRLGIKPLLYFKGEQHFAFASSLASILASGLVLPVLNNQAFFQFLGNGSVIQPDTMIKGVKSLMPGHYMTYQRGKLEFHRYWKQEVQNNLVRELGDLQENELVDRTRLMLEESCSYHMVADVPIGSFLSGGVDSTTITALMARKSVSKIKTFSIGFESGSDYSNELSEARIAADFIKTDHTECILKEKDIISHFDEFISVLDQPSIDGLNTFFVSKACKGVLKVAFSGLGADEIFAGYSHFGWPSKYKNINIKLLDKIGAGLYAHFPRNILYNSYLASLSFRERLQLLRRQFSNSLIGQVVNENLMRSFSHNYMDIHLNSMNLDAEDSVNTHSQYEIQHYLLNTLLRDTDAVSLGNSLEVRPPFLDHKLVEFALALPESIKWRNGVGKYVLKEAAKDLLPNDFFTRKKTGFTLPISRWMYGDLGLELRKALSEKSALDYLSQVGIDKIINDLDNKKNGWKLYQILVFLKWAELHKVIKDE